MMMCGAKCPPVHPSLRTSVSPCMRSFVPSSVRPRMRPQILPCFCRCLRLPVCLSVCLFVCISVYLFLCLTLPVCLSDDKPEPPRHSALTALRRPGSTNDPTRMATIQETDRKTRCPRTQAQPTQQQIKMVQRHLQCPH